MADGIAGTLGGVAAGNGGRNQALDAFDARCRRAMEARRMNEENRRWAEQNELEPRRLDLEERGRRRDLEVEDRRLRDEAARNGAIASSLRACTQKDPQACLEACKLDQSSGCTLLGFMFLKGDGVAQSKESAATAFRSGCRLGDASACQMLGLAAPSQPSAQPSKLMIFGGKAHDVYLGCLCDPTVSDSVLNEFGKFGKNGFNPGGSLWSPLSEFRRAIGDTSACSTFATDPPAVVQQDGTFIGRLTLNTSRRDAISEKTVLQWLDRDVCGEPQ